MNSSRFKKELENIVPLVLSYAADYYKLQQYKNSEEALEKIGKKEFLNKCHEGFKIAQDRIISGLLELESESKLYKKKLNKLKIKQKPFKDVTKK